VVVVAAVLTLAFVGFAAAQASNQTYTNKASLNTATNDGIWGWIGNCFGYGYGPNQGYDSQPVAPHAPYQGGYGNGYGYGFGPCWVR